MTSHTSTPRSDDPEDIKRRDFIKTICGATLGFLTLTLTWPLVSYIIPPSGEGAEGKFIKVPNFPSIPTGQPTKMTFEDTDRQLFLVSSIIYDIWVIKHSATEATIYSPLCPHLNCRYTWLKNQFVCPCHGSIFNENGKVLGGPSPRPLDELPHKIEGGELYVEWRQYKAGIPAKVEA